MQNTEFHKRKGERGVTILLVAAAMVSLLAMAALAIDVVTLYVARNEAQRAANAAALAGAKMFVYSGFTSAMLGDPTLATTQSQVCVSGASGNSAAANKAAEAAATSNQVAGQNATVSAITCDFTSPANPHVAVTIQQTGLPTFFSKIWGGGTSNQVTATATAEAFNSSGPAGAAPNNPANIQTQVSSLKPFLIPNCDPALGPPLGTGCPTTGYFINPTTFAAINSSSYIGQVRVFYPATTVAPAGPPSPPPPPELPYYVVDVPAATVCPGSSAVSCSNVGVNAIHDSIACASTATLACGGGTALTLPVDSNTLGGVNTSVIEGTECLIHAGSGGSGGQDLINASTGPGIPVTVDGGNNNPNPNLRNVTNISRSESVITVPIYDGHDPCPSGTPCNTASATVTVLGFLQLGIVGIQDTGAPPTRGALTAVILNVSSCNSAATGNVVAGGGLSSLPVRLIQ